MDVLKLLEYNRWANSLIASQIETLSQEIIEKDLGGSFGSMRAILVHLIESDWIWLNRFRGIPPGDEPNWNETHVKMINQEWTRIQDEMLAVSKQMMQNSNTMIEFKTRKGQPFIMPIAEIITHISHHGSYHRGQLANMIRMVGEKPVSTDYFIFSVQKK